MVRVKSPENTNTTQPDTYLLARRQSSMSDDMPWVNRSSGTKVVY